ncbi:SGNH hydrolase-type esterase domain-containing protein [Echria macrotheca]|uniref:SGNH hydrolase-type esterase domain-containing protein n=1 Tax=Echria macrotheca TaxID=438768 RepID=A0AAJ0FB17_9PEZI|nr:SGNH hydrolase-type esterase domain-containing protein [Echria macrotheca]
MAILRALIVGGLLLGSSVVAECGKHWVSIWTSMPQLVEPANLPPAPFNGTTSVFNNATLRQTIYLTQDADTIRLYFSNVFGATDLAITSASVALPAAATNQTGNGTVLLSAGAGASAVRPDTIQRVTFSGQRAFTIPPGALAVSDPLNITVRARSVLSVSVYLEAGQAGFAITGHPGSRTTSFAVPGEHVATADLASVPGVGKTDHWYFLSAVDAWVPSSRSAVVVVGDSISDGRGSTTNGNNRWPDQLLARLQSSPSTSNIAILNQAAGGNRILNDGLGPNALSRIERDVIAQPGVRYAIIYEGVNDLGTSPTDAASLARVGDRLLTAYDQMITRLHTAGIAVFGATITPMSGPGQTYSDAGREAQRQRVNNWIRTSNRFDAVIDFDLAVRDPRNTTQLAPAFDVGDYLHLNPDGYRTMAETVDLGLFSKFAGGYVHRRMV